MEFRLLGPLSVTADTGESLDIGRPKLRVLLAILLTRANCLVSAEALVDDLWGSRPPGSARANLKTYVSALRRLLCPSDPTRAPIVFRQRGYSIRLDCDELDLLAFERLIGEGEGAQRRGELPRAIKSFEEALALWRGSALEDIPLSAEALTGAVRRFDEQRLTTLETVTDLRMSLGRHRDVVAELEASIAGHPLRERLWEQLMVALYRDGRQAEALAAYQRLRTHLITELGIEPGHGVRSLQARILTADPTLLASGNDASIAASGNVGIRPRQLPLDVATFVGRDEQVAAVCHQLMGANPVTVIHGPPGVGKSALAIRAANRLSGDFPDGQVYLNLCGATPGVAALTPAEGVGRVLRTLGVSAQDLPCDIEECGVLFRTLVAGRRMLILLDNAVSAAQLRPLLPGQASVVVLVTSRISLADLGGSNHLKLGPLSPPASEIMLRGLLGDGRVARELEACQRLAELCDHFPLALQVAAARLKVRPGWRIRELVDRVADQRHRLNELQAGDVAVRSSLNVSFAALRGSDDSQDRAAARAFCVLGLYPASTVDTTVAAALLGLDAAEARRVIERLVDAHLIESVEPGRHRLHDLVRLFAAEVAVHEVPAAQHMQALTRVLRHDVATAREATRLAYPLRTHHPLPDEVSGVVGLALADSTDARDWLERERTNLVAVARQALSGPPEQARLGVALALSLHWFFAQAFYPVEAIGLYDAVLHVARVQGDRRSEACAHDCLGISLTAVGKLDEARAHLEAGLVISRQLGDRFAEQRALGNIGATLMTQGQLVAAIDYLEQQLQAAGRCGASIGETFALIALGATHRRLGRLDVSVELLTSALARTREGDDYFRAAILEELGITYVERREPERAVRALELSVEVARRHDNRAGEAWALCTLSRTWRILGAHDKARECVEAALGISQVPAYSRAGIAIRAEHAEIVALAC